MPQAAQVQVSLATPSPSTWKANSEGKLSLCKAERRDEEMNCYLVLLAMQYHKVKILTKTRQSGESLCSSSLPSLADTNNRKTKYNTSWSTSLVSAGSKDTFSSHPDHFIPPKNIYFAIQGCPVRTQAVNGIFIVWSLVRGDRARAQTRFPLTCSLIQDNTFIFDCRGISK